MRDDAVDEGYGEYDGCARTRMRVRSHLNRLGECWVVDEVLNLVEAVLLGESLVIDQYTCSRVFAGQFDCYSVTDSGGEGFRLFEVG